MSANRQQAQQHALADATQSPSNTMLVVGDLARWKSEGRLSEDIADYAFVGIDALTEDVIRESDPVIVLSPLIADDFDAIQVAEKLVRIGFQGKYRAIADTLPQPEMIRKEVQAVAQGLDFDLLLVPPQPD